MKQIRKKLTAVQLSYEKSARKATEKLKQYQQYGHLRAINTKKGPRYYYVTKIGDTKGRYLTKSAVDQELARHLAQRDYWRKVLRISRAGIRAICRFLKDVPEISLSQIDADSPARRRLIKPVLPSDQEYVALWLSQPYTGKPFRPDTPQVITDRGERVRSKSEKIIADKLTALGIPYRYEAPLQLKDRHGCTFTAYPDFTFLDVANRRQLYLEHFGMMDKEEYRALAVEKLAAYEKTGIIPGVNLIFTMDFDGRSFDSRILEHKLCAVLPDATSLNLIL